MADNYIEKRMDDLRQGRRPETEEQIRRRVQRRREAERLAAEAESNRLTESRSKADGTD